MDYTIFRQRDDVALALIAAEHIPSLLTWINDQEITKYLGRSWPLGPSEEKKYVEELYSSKNNLNFLILIKEQKSDDAPPGWLPIGCMGLHNIDQINQSAETGAVIGEKEYQGRGYGSKAKMLLLEYCFNYLNLRTVTSKVYGSNKRSLAYNKRCGYEVCGIIPRCKYRNGKWEDEVTLVVTKKRFLSLTKNKK